jgi:SAM-dependent methyltransferase
MQAISFMSALILLAAFAACGPEPEENSASRPVYRINSYQLITGDDSEAERAQWNRAYRTRSWVHGEEPERFLRESVPHLSHGGRALVFPMEEGANAVFLARQGWDVTGIDFSEEAIRRSKRLARKHNVQLHVINADLNTYNIDPDSYDLIVALDFYRPRIIHEIRKGLRHGGTVVWQSTLSSEEKPNLLKPGQLATSFDGYRTVMYRESGGEPKPQASLIAIKP